MASIEMLIMEDSGYRGNVRKCAVASQPRDKIPAPDKSSLLPQTGSTSAQDCPEITHSTLGTMHRLSPACFVGADRDSPHGHSSAAILMATFYIQTGTILADQSHPGV